MILLGVGSSIGDAQLIFAAAIEHLSAHGVQVVARSKNIKTAPEGGVAVNEFTNAVWQVQTDLAPLELLTVLKTCESAAGRKARARWDDRELDLDILLYHAVTLDTPELTLPHPRMLQRQFVLQPLADLLGRI